jgi:glycolate oxidase FAD binding subunit
VVKNSAGFDLPKLMVGSLGMFGVLVELTFKVFPAAPAHVTVTQSVAPLETALDALSHLYTARMEIDSLDFAPEGTGLKFWVRLAGLADGLPARADRVRGLLGGGEVLHGDVEDKLWQTIRAFDNVSNELTLVKVPITPNWISEVEAQLNHMQRHYSAGGNVVWLKSQAPAPALHETLCSLGLPGLVVFGQTDQIRIGARNGQALEARVKQVFDPQGIFPNYQ